MSVWARQSNRNKDFGKKERLFVSVCVWRWTACYQSWTSASSQISAGQPVALLLQKDTLTGRRAFLHCGVSIFVCYSSAVNGCLSCAASNKFTFRQT